MNISLGFSPCPNDTFIFDALVNKKIDTQGINFTVSLQDVQTLNNWAIEEKLDVTKISYGVLPLLLKKYKVLNSGGALGMGVGPLLIGKNPVEDVEETINSMRIAIPGENTTAHLLFSLAFPKAYKKLFTVFNQVEDKVLSNEVDAGVIIHENRFTYQHRGLVKLMDLGAYWESKTGVPIPLGGIVIKKSFPLQLQQTIDNLIKQSVKYAFANYPLLPDYVKIHSQEMEEAVMRKHIDLYVNDFSIDLGPDGIKAIETLMHIYNQLHQLPTNLNTSFVVDKG